MTPMEITISSHTLRALLADAAELGATAALCKIGSLKPFLSKQEAYKLYGRANVDRWIMEGHVVANKDGDHSAKCRIDRVQIETIAKSSKRHTYLTVNERSKNDTRAREININKKEQ
jgi:hypothetical protein